MPAPPSRILASWLDGADPACDVVVPTSDGSAPALPADAIRARIRARGSRSTNGTFVDDVRLAPRRPKAVTAAAAHHAGARDAAPVADAEPAGRADAPAASASADLPSPTSCSTIRRCRGITRGSSPRAVPCVVEDLNSSNGTAINEIENRVARAGAACRRTMSISGRSRFRPRGCSAIAASSSARRRSSRWPSPRDSMVIGRDPQCDQPVDHPMVSWRHARLSRTPTGSDGGGSGVPEWHLRGRRAGDRQERDRRRARKSRWAASASSCCPTAGCSGATIGATCRSRRSTSRSTRPTAAVCSIRSHSPCIPRSSSRSWGLRARARRRSSRRSTATRRRRSGQVLFNGADLYTLYDLFRQQMGYVPQDDIVHSRAHRASRRCTSRAAPAHRLVRRQEIDGPHRLRSSTRSGSSTRSTRSSDRRSTRC